MGGKDKISTFDKSVLSQCFQTRIIQEMPIMRYRPLYSLILLLFLSPDCATAQDRAYPVEGDGIRSFLRRWNRIDTSYVREFRELNSGRLNESGGLVLGRIYFIPPLHPGDQFPAEKPSGQPVDPVIFGKEYNNVPVRSSSLKGACFYLISGHGGPDPGALTRVDGRVLHEDEYNYDFILRLARNLMSHGATVYLIIEDEDDGIRDERYLVADKDETCMGDPIPRSQIDRLKQRVDKVNELYREDKTKYDYVRALEIHIDSRNPKRQIDLFLYYADNPQSRLTSYALRDKMKDKYDEHQPGRGFSGSVTHRNLYILREMDPPAIMVEAGNFQHPLDRRRILDSNNRQAVANWLTLGFIGDFNNSR